MFHSFHRSGHLLVTAHTKPKTLLPVCGARQQPRNITFAKMSKAFEVRRFDAASSCRKAASSRRLQSAARPGQLLWANSWNRVTSFFSLSTSTRIRLKASSKSRFRSGRILSL